MIFHKFLTAGSELRALSRQVCFETRASSIAPSACVSPFNQLRDFCHVIKEPTGSGNIYVPIELLWELFFLLARIWTPEYTLFYTWAVVYRSLYWHTHVLVIPFSVPSDPSIQQGMLCGGLLFPTCRLKCTYHECCPALGASYHAYSMVWPNGHHAIRETIVLTREIALNYSRDIW